MSDESKILKLLSSGNFTVAYHDNGQCALYEGKYKYDDLPEESFYDFEMNDNYIGYAPAIVCHLVKALKGKCESI